MESTALKHTTAQILAAHQDYMNFLIPARDVYRKHNMESSAFLYRAHKMGLSVRPKGFQLANARGKNNLDNNRLRYLWFYTFAYKRRAKRKGLTFSLSEDDFIRLVTSSCFYCEKSYLEETRVVNRSKVHMLTVDRIDSQREYELDNCVSCCKECNTIKMDIPVKTWIKKLRKILDTCEHKFD